MYNLERKFICWFSLSILIISCFFYINPIIHNRPNINNSIILHSNSSNYPSDIFHIIIDDNWTESEALYDWCSGSGSWNNPYVIDNIILDCEEKGSGIIINNSKDSYFVIQNCTFYNCSNFAAIKLQDSVNGQLIDNNLSYYNHIGIELVNVDNSSFFSNDLIFNEIGVLIQGTNNSEFYQNYIHSNSMTGINLTSTGSESNTFYNNSFISNGINAYDAGTYTEWDNNLLGNYWDDYGGSDLDDNGFGDDPYLLDGPANAQDNYPIWNDGDDISPILTVISPFNNTIWSTPPQLNVSAYDLDLDTIWYLVGGFEQIEELQNKTTEFLLSTFWNGLPEGKFNISYYANDTSGNINEAIVLDLYKDTQAPFLNIITPSNHTYWNTRPTIQVSVSDTYFQSVWYEINGQEEGLENGIPETLNISLWDTIPNESSFTIQFFANDTSGNVNDSYTLDLYKDINAPELTINLPSNYTYWNSVHDLNVTVYEKYLDSFWYEVDTEKITLSNNTLDALDIGIWNSLSDETSFTINFFANDSAGNVNDIKSLLIYKDISTPTIEINQPINNSYWNSPPTIQITIIDSYFDRVWYEVTGTKIFLENGVPEAFDLDTWYSLPDETSFTINFFANDSAGNLNDTFSLLLYRDIQNPDLSINSPNNNSYWNALPAIQTTATDTYFDSIWYEVAGTKIFLENGVSEAFDLGIWNSLPDETSFTINFFANDSAGNLNDTFSLLLYRDIQNPDLSINYPYNNSYWNALPAIQATATDMYFDSLWYEVAGTKIFLENGVSEAFDLDTWNSLPNEGEFFINFFANDSAGNINNSLSLTLHKDLITPSVDIILPGNYSYWNTLPDLQVSVIDMYFNSIWYEVAGTKIFLESGVSEALDLNIWNSLPDEYSFTINIFANDSAGNLNDTFSLLLYKDIQNPNLIISVPLNNTYWNTLPTTQATATDTYFDSIWYEVAGTKIFLENGVSEAFDLDIWDSLPDEGLFIVNFFANDSAGNINNSLSLILHKDLITPSVDIILPGNYTYWNTLPDLQVSVIDMYFYSIWYEVAGTKIFLENGVPEAFDLDTWNSLPDETLFNINFFANDSAGNINNTFTILLYKDIVTPSITINLPGNCTYWNTLPDLQVSVIDMYFDSLWYEVAGTKAFIENGIIEAFDLDTWNSLSNEGEFSLKFFANDSAGNFNNSFSLLLYKDVQNPDLTINSPYNNSYWNALPAIQATVADAYFDSIWYEVAGTKVFLENGVSEAFDLDIWNSLPYEGEFSINLFANDSAGNLNNIFSLLLHKDIKNPDILISSPSNNSYWNVLPTIQATATDTYFDSIWYEVNGIKKILTNGMSEEMYSIIWNNLPPEGVFLLHLFANDSAGNLNNSISFTLFKDTVTPTIAINLPGNNTYWNMRPNLQVSISDTYFDSVWYEISGSKAFLDNGISQPLNSTLWDNLLPECSFIVYFYANDSAGNINDSYSFLLHKDISSPVITVNDPSEFEVFGLVEPICSVDFYDLNGIDQSWYQLTNGSLTTIIRQWNGSIDANDWDLMSNGTVFLLLYANDSLGNIRTLSFTVYKDIISPSITFHSPKPYDLFGIIAPYIDLTIYDPHLETVWYQLENGSLSSGLLLWTGAIDSTTWDLMGNGSVTIRFIAYDSLNNIAYNNLIVRKNIHDPVITIIQPDEGTLEGILPPELELYVASAAIDSIWYCITNGSTITNNINWTGNIDENLWNIFGDGIVYLYFFINDTLGNTGSDVILLLKDVTAPSITINSPDSFELFGSTPPEISVLFYDLNIIDQTWYQLYSPVTTTPVRNWTGNINQNDWDLMPNGTITIIFFANDSVGNLRTVNLSVYKDIIEPYINIYNPPEGDLYGSLVPLIYFYADDSNGISQITYQLSNGTITTPRFDWSGTIDQDLWVQFGNGTITIYIYATDTIGNEGFDSLLLRKDIIAPSINIQVPLNYQEVGRESPFFEVYMTDANLATCWYRIMGTGEDIIFSGIYGKINQILWENLWDSLLENDSIMIRFCANDTIGNLNYEELILFKPTSTEEPLLFPFDLMEMIPLSLVIGFTVVLSVAIKKSRFYNISSEKHKKFINRMLILTALLVTLITASVLTQSL